ncbi:MAG: OmpP1/FadL family transporter [Cellvibrionaceae bacterium]
MFFYPIFFYKSLISKFFLTFISLSVIASIYSEVVAAGGFQISDHSVAAMGRAQAGYGIVGDDASAVYFNPAGMVLLDKKFLQIGAVYFDTSAEIENTGSTGFNAGDNGDGTRNSVVPNVFFVMPLENNIHIGLGLTVPFATRNGYEDNFFGRYNGLETELVFLDLNPVISYQVSEHLSIGGGISLQKSDVIYNTAVYTGAPVDAELNLDADSDISLGYNLGLMVSLSESARFGFGYRSKVDHDIEGGATFANVGPASGTFNSEVLFEAPATAYAAYVQHLSPKVILSLGARWTDWSSLEEIRIEYPEGNSLGGEDTVVRTAWKDAWTYNIGVDYIYNNDWRWRFGLAFDESPIIDGTRSVRNIDGDRRIYSFGANYALSKSASLDFAYGYIDFSDTKIDQVTFAFDGTPASVRAEFNSTRAHTFAVQLNYTF